MVERRNTVDTKKVDTQEFEIPETIFVRDIENRVFQDIVLKVLSNIEGISLLEGNFIDSLLGRTPTENVKGIYAEQDMRNHSISIKVEINICYGLSIPEKAEEIQTKVAEEITKLTGLHVSCVHVIFKGIMSEADAAKKFITPVPKELRSERSMVDPEEEYSDEF